MLTYREKITRTIIGDYNSHSSVRKWISIGFEGEDLAEYWNLTKYLLTFGETRRILKTNGEVIMRDGGKEIINQGLQARQATRVPFFLSHSLG